MKLLVSDHRIWGGQGHQACHESALSDMCVWAPQVETGALPHIIVDVRRPEEVAYGPLPEALVGGVNLPGATLCHRLATHGMMDRNLYVILIEHLQLWGVICRGSLLVALHLLQQQNHCQT